MMFPCTLLQKPLSTGFVQTVFVDSFKRSIALASPVYHLMDVHQTSYVCYTIGRHIHTLYCVVFFFSSDAGTCEIGATLQWSVVINVAKVR